MVLKFTNSLTKHKERFEPIEPGKVRMYSCGVTVYDKCHIGHARSLYVVEIIRRYLRYRGYDVTFVRNITDVDDKIIKKAHETGLSFEQVIEDNIALYYHDLETLGIPPADEEPRATKNIDIMIIHIQGLIEKGLAYASGGDVFFRVREFGEYGKLSGQSVDQMREAVRIQKVDNKEDPLDFVLWKASKPCEPSWPSPWGEGRPGWHIECSCMSMKHLGVKTLDIHAGGRDLIFPHHENEVAQSEGLTGKPFAHYWIHNGLLTINGQKMAKSLGNFITVEDALQSYDANVLKLFFLTSHYSSAMDYNEERLKDAQKNWEKINILVGDLRKRDLSPGEKPSDEPTRWTQEFREAMDDDLNTPKALAVLFEMIRWCRKLMGQDGGDKKKDLRDARDFLDQFADIFGVHFSETRQLSADVEALLKERSLARQNKDFARSDQLRDELKEQGVLVEDGKDGQKWRRA